MESSFGSVEQLLGGKAIKPQQPVGLIQSVFTPKWRRGTNGRQEVCVVDGDISGIKDALQPIAFIEGRGQREDLTIGCVLCPAGAKWGE